MLFCSNY